MSTIFGENSDGINPEQAKLWVDAWSYGQKIINKGVRAPWKNVSSLVSYHRQLQGLVNSDIVTIEVSDFYDAWIEDHPELIDLMKRKTRTGYALRTMLSDELALEHLHEIVQAICDSYQDKPVVLVLPSPRIWLKHANSLTEQDDRSEVTWDDADSSVLYVANFLRTFADCHIYSIMFRDIPLMAPTSDDDMSRYSPIENIASHYRWKIFYNGFSDVYKPLFETPTDLHVISDASLCVPAMNLDWTYDENELKTKHIDTELFYINVPEDTVPEAVLEKLEKLRGLIKEGVA